MPVLSAIADGYEVYFVTERLRRRQPAKPMTWPLQRMIQAGGHFPRPHGSYVSELQRRLGTRGGPAGDVTKLFERNTAAALAQGLRWEWQASSRPQGRAPDNFYPADGQLWPSRFTLILSERQMDSFRSTKERHSSRSLVRKRSSAKGRSHCTSICPGEDVPGINDHGYGPLALIVEVHT